MEGIPIVSTLHHSHLKLVDGNITSASFNLESRGAMSKLYKQRHRLLALFRVAREFVYFIKRDYSSPSPNFIKMKTLLCYACPAGSWVETGTYMGGTTKYLAHRFPKVISIEPSEHFYEYSKSRLRKYKNVVLVNGTSEDCFEEALALTAPIGNLWLDGHFSEGGTFLGSSISPISEELAVVAKHRDSFKELVIFIDDVRLFPRRENMETGYPTFQTLMDWCRDNEFDWQIQNDIFIAQMKAKKEYP